MQTPECEKGSDREKCTHRWSLRSIREHPNDALLGCSERDTSAECRSAEALNQSRVFPLLTEVRRMYKRATPMGCQY